MPSSMRGTLSIMASALLPVGGRDALEHPAHGRCEGGGAHRRGSSRRCCSRPRHRASTAAATSSGGAGSGWPLRAASRCKVSATIARTLRSSAARRARASGSRWAYSHSSADSSHHWRCSLSSANCPLRASRRCLVEPGPPMVRWIWARYWSKYLGSGFQCFQWYPSWIALCMIRRALGSHQLRWQRRDGSCASRRCHLGVDVHAALVEQLVGWLPRGPEEVDRTASHRDAAKDRERPVG